MMASDGRDLGSPGLRYWLRTGLPVRASIAGTSRKSSAAGVATISTVQPCSWASLTSWPTSEAGPAPQTMTVRTRRREHSRWGGRARPRGLMAR